MYALKLYTCICTNIVHIMNLKINIWALNFLFKFDNWYFNYEIYYFNFLKILKFETWYLTLKIVIAIF
jgi:hypothetical protein